MKKWMIVAFAMVVSSVTYAQHFRHGITTGSYVNFGNQSPWDVSAVGTIGYTPRFIFSEQENTSISVGLPLSLGFSGTATYSDYYADASFRYMIDAPVVVDFNWGAGSSQETEKRFGLFAGVGFGMNYANYFDNYNYIEQSFLTFGPTANMGMRFAVGRRQKNVEVKFSYGKFFSEPKPSYAGIVAGFNF